MQEKAAESVDAIWAKLVSRATRVALARQDISYAQLAAKLAEQGVEETARSIEGKIQRGTFRFTFFLQTVTASGVDYPPAWRSALKDTDSWDARASAVLKQSLAAQPWVDWAALSKRLLEIGVVIPQDVLADAVETGTFSAALFLQCAAVCRFEDLGRFLDSSSVIEAAMAGIDTGK